MLQDLLGFPVGILSSIGRKRVHKGMVRNQITILFLANTKFKLDQGGIAFQIIETVGFHTKGVVIVILLPGFHPGMDGVPALEWTGFPARGQRGEPESLGKAPLHGKPLFSLINPARQPACSSVFFNIPLILSSVIVKSFYVLQYIVKSF